MSLDRHVDGVETHGVRLIPGKCCGRWVTVTAWPLSLRDLRGVADEFANAVEDVEEGGAR